MPAQVEVKKGLTPKDQQLDQETLDFISEFAGKYIKPEGPIKPPENEGDEVEVSVWKTKPHGSRYRKNAGRVNINQHLSHSGILSTSIYVWEPGVVSLTANTHEQDDSSFHEDKPIRPFIRINDDRTGAIIVGHSAIDRARKYLGMETPPTPTSITRKISGVPLVTGG